MNSSDIDYAPVILTFKQLKQWWVIAAGMILGALIGWTISLVISPVYEASFKVTTNINLAANPEVNEIMMDKSINHVGDLAYQPDLVAQVIKAESAQGINLSQEEFIAISSVERKATATVLKVRWKDPITAAQIANTWGRLFFTSLQNGYTHAVVAEDLSVYQEELKSCLSEQNRCGFEKEQLDDEIAANAEKIAAETNLSLGLYPGLSVSSYQEAEISASPLRHARGSSIAAGTVIGFIASLIFTEWLFSRKK